MSKYGFTGKVKKVFGVELKQIVAMETFASIEVGFVGGWIEKEENLCQSGNAWVYGDAWVSGNAWVSGDAEVSGDAKVYGDASIMWASKIGSRNGTTTAFATKTGVSITCGCFYGDLAEFEQAVEETHGNNKHGKEYKAFIQMVKAHFELGA